MICLSSRGVVCGKPVVYGSFNGPNTKCFVYLNIEIQMQYNSYDAYDHKQLIALII